MERDRERVRGGRERGVKKGEIERKRVREKEREAGGGEGEEERGRERKNVEERGDGREE